MNAPTEAESNTSIPSTVAGLRGDPWLPVLAMVALGLLILIVASVLGTASLLAGANPEIRFGSLTGRAAWMSDVWTELRPGDVLVRIDGRQVDGDPRRISTAMRGLDPGVLEVEVLRGGETVDDSAEIARFGALDTLLIWSRTATGALLAVLGLLAVALRPASLVSRLFFGFCVSLSCHLVAYLALPANPPLGLMLECVGLNLCAALGVHLFAVFPRALVPKSWPMIGLYGPAITLSLFELIWHPSRDLVPWLIQAFKLTHLLALVASLLAAALLIRQLMVARRQDDIASEGRAWSLLLGVVLGLAPSAVLNLLPVFERGANWAFNSFAVTIFAILATHAIVRRNVLAVDRFNAAVVGYAATLALLLIAFGVLVIGLPTLLGQAGWLDTPASVALVTGAAFLLFQPVHRKLRQRADRWFLREPVTTGLEVQTLQSLADKVRDLDVPAALRAGVDATLVLGVERSELWTRTAGDELVRSVTSGPGPATSGLIRSESAKAGRSATHESSPRPALVSQNREAEVPRAINCLGPLAVALDSGSGGIADLCDRSLDAGGQSELWSLDLAMATLIAPRGRAEAMLGVARKRNGSAFTANDRVFLDAVASQVALALERDWHQTLRVGPYRLRGRLGTGGMAEVFLAEKRGPGGFERRLALKRILPHLASDPAAVTSFLDEARIAAQLHHPNIVQVHDIEVFDETYYLAMELMDGPSLQQILRRVGAMEDGLPLPVVASFAVALLSALAHAHDRKDVRDQPLRIVHRDVKPGNVLTSRHGEIKLGDFGIAKAESRLHQTAPGLAPGTPAYMAPEIQSGSADASAASDLFSAGIVLLEMLTLRRPRRVNGQARHPTLPDSLVADRRRRLDGFFRRALAEAPQDRFTDAQSMQVAFLSALGAHPADVAAVAELITAVEPEPPQPDSGELDAFRPADLTDTSLHTL